VTGPAAAKVVPERRLVWAFVAAMGAELAARLVCEQVAAGTEDPEESADVLATARVRRREAEAALPPDCGWRRTTEGLSPLERDVVGVLLCLGEEVALPRLLSAQRIPLNEQARVGRLLSLLVADPVERLEARGIFAADAPLFQKQLLLPVSLGRHDRLADVELRLTQTATAMLLDDDSPFGHLCPGLIVDRPTERLEGLVASDEVHEALRRLVRAARSVADGVPLPDAGLTYGTGLVAFFVGPAGTGKTLAARAVAGEAGVPLVTMGVDGEGSWRSQAEWLRVAVHRAEADGAVLLVDECDRFLVEQEDEWTAPSLLPILEAARGVVILATNRPVSVCEALRRRLATEVAFPPPDAAARTRIWRALLPEGCPADLHELGRRYRLTGGHVKNAVLDVLRAGPPTHEALSKAAERRVLAAEQSFEGMVAVEPVEARPALAGAVSLAVKAQTDPWLRRLRELGEVGAPVVLLEGRDLYELRTAAEELVAAAGFAWVQYWSAFELFGSQARIGERIRTLRVSHAAAVVILDGDADSDPTGVIHRMFSASTLVVLVWPGSARPPAALRERAWARLVLNDSGGGPGRALQRADIPHALSADAPAVTGATLAQAVAAARARGADRVEDQDVGMVLRSRGAAPLFGPG
jgi:hypothetical protein